MTWEKTSYRERYLYDGGRVVGKIEWGFVADHWNAYDCVDQPYKDLGTWQSEELAKRAVERNYGTETVTRWT